MINWQHGIFRSVYFIVSKYRIVKTAIAVLILFFFNGGLQGTSLNPDEAVLYIFEGSDWCTHCARLEKNILTNEAFLKEIGALNIKLERIDFPQRTQLPPETRKYNDEIAEKFGFDGTFPTLILVRMDSEKTRRIIYHNESVETMLQMIRNNLQLLYE
jgi:thiol-disulfide isomerase/thioredoxin